MYRLSNYAKKMNVFKKITGHYLRLNDVITLERIFLNASWVQHLLKSVFSFLLDINCVILMHNFFIRRCFPLQTYVIWKLSIQKDDCPVRVYAVYKFFLKKSLDIKDYLLSSTCIARNQLPDFAGKDQMSNFFLHLENKVLNLSLLLLIVVL